MNHALGVLGVLAAGVLLAVSAAMNWQFGYSLGRSEFDGQIYGAASAAADCLKALIPFFFFAAIRNRMWSQAGAAAVLGVVVTAYSLTSALGHAALNRMDTSGVRTAGALSYQDARADLKRAQDQLGWVPQHRPAQVVQSDIDSLKTQRPWTWTKGCSDVTGKQGRDFCQQFHGLSAEIAAASQAQALELRIADIQSKLAQSKQGQSAGGHASLEGDPQAAVLARLVTPIFPSITTADVQTALTVFVAILLEVGSGFGMYVAFSSWRLHDVHAPAAPRMASVSTAAVAVAAPSVLTPAVAIAKPRSSANDNVTKVAVAVAAAPQRLVAPETDVERFYKERIDTQDGSSLTATSLYEDYCSWCEMREKEPLALPTFGREFGELGVQKAKVAGRVRYIGIALRTALERPEDKKLPALSSQAA
ncbi:MAG: hypothetical protein C0511_02435 [Hyphomicrobium sp.]|nr:hypothetical protein [Hyphomicrobium sp.]